MRALEKWAVRIGGGMNHRFGLFDMIMLKDNHIDYAGGIVPAIERARNYIGSTGKDLKIEVEARNLKDVEDILKTQGVDRIMLDNFSPELIVKAVKLINKRAETEASGGITETNLLDYAKTGVDFISVGALTHSVKSLDLSLKAFN
jgi:nicotinate-nucleotide pyrophosphorylase (carboxylating)